jgi:translation elongation factor EF-Tu-like GTPase
MYRPDAEFPFDGVKRYGIQFFESDAFAGPDEVVETNVWVRSAAAEVMASVTAGTTFLIYEGGTTVADAIVLEVLKTTE